MKNNGKSADYDCDNDKEIDYYGVLKLINRRCKPKDIRRAFRRLALNLHPQRDPALIEKDEGDDEDDEENSAEPSRSEEARATKFAMVAEAYDVLSDPLKRTVYDQVGEKGLKTGIQGCSEPYVYHGEPLRTYREFFGTENPYADILDNWGNPTPVDNVKEPKKKKDEPIIKALSLTLGEVFFGGIKKMKIERYAIKEEFNNKKGPTTVLEQKVLSIPIMPGIPAGTKILFPEEGDQSPTTIPADIIIETEDEPHETFERSGSNLKMTVKIFLKEALTGTIVTVNTIDERTLRIPITTVISPHYEKIISGEGLPTIEEPDSRGDLIISFNIEFPMFVAPTSKTLFLKAFEALSLQDKDKNSKDSKNEFVAKNRTNKMVMDGKLYTRDNKLAQVSIYRS